MPASLFHNYYIIFREAKDEDIAKYLILFGASRMMLASLFHNYYYQGEDLKLYFFYDYIKVISYMKYNIRQKGNISFDKYHLNLWSKVQWLSTILVCKMLVVLIGLFSINKNAKDAIRDSHFKTDIKHNDIVLILFTIFILWH